MNSVISNYKKLKYLHRFPPSEYTDIGIQNFGVCCKDSFPSQVFVLIFKLYYF